jgi:hypothetical protein
MEPLTIKTLIGEVAKRHGVVLNATDPILMTVTLNEVILGHYLERLNALLEHAQDTANAQIKQQLDAARQIAVQPVEEAKVAAAKLVTDGAAYLVEQVRAASVTALAQIEQAQQQVYRAKRAAFWTAVVAGLLAAFALGATLSLLLRHG